MPENLVVTLPKDMPLTERILEASRQIKEWIKSLEDKVEGGAERLQLVKSEQTKDSFKYYYSIYTRRELSASDVNARKR